MNRKNGITGNWENRIKEVKESRIQEFQAIVSDQ